MMPALSERRRVEGRPLAVLALAFGVQYVGLACERWYFLADANHPQNLYYRSRA